MPSFSSQSVICCIGAPWGGAGINSIPQKRGALYSGPATARPTASSSRGSRRTLSRPAHDRQWLPEVFPSASPPVRLTTGSRLTAKRTSGRGRVGAGHMHQHLGRGRRAGPIGRPRPSSDIGRCRLAGSPRAIPQQQSHKRLSAEWATEHGASETIARLSISSPRTGTPTRRFGLWQNMRPYSAKCLTSGGSAAPPCPEPLVVDETTTARETLGGHTLERPMRRLRADRGDNPDPGIQRQSTCRSMLTGATRLLDNEPECAPAQPAPFAAAPTAASRSHASSGFLGS
jgi:hypothetical protein